MDKFCPCHSNKPYEECCSPYHHGALPENALALMRSRYAAYALGLSDYLIETKYQDLPLSISEKERLTKDILTFCASTTFENLKIIEFIDGPEEAHVTFIAYLKQGDYDATFKEKSHFVKKNGRWLYTTGVLSNPNL